MTAIKQKSPLLCKKKLRDLDGWGKSFHPYNQIPAHYINPKNVQKLKKKLTWKQNLEISSWRQRNYSSIPDSSLWTLYAPDPLLRWSIPVCPYVHIKTFGWVAKHVVEESELAARWVRSHSLEVPTDEPGFVAVFSRPRCFNIHVVSSLRSVVWWRTSVEGGRRTYWHNE